MYRNGLLSRSCLPLPSGPDQPAAVPAERIQVRCPRPRDAHHAAVAAQWRTSAFSWDTCHPLPPPCPCTARVIC